MASNTRRNIFRMSWQETARRLMREQKITQEHLAERMGKTQGAVGHWLNSRREPSIDDLRQIALWIGIAPVELLREELELDAWLGSAPRLPGPIQAAEKGYSKGEDGQQMGIAMYPARRPTWHAEPMALKTMEHRVHEAAPEWVGTKNVAYDWSAFNASKLRQLLDSGRLSADDLKTLADLAERLAGIR